LTFAPESVLLAFLSVLQDAEKNSTSNGGSFNGDHWAEGGGLPKYCIFDPLQPVILADSLFRMYAGFFISFVRCRKKFCIEWW